MTKRKPTSVSSQKTMSITEDYRCKKCRGKVGHWYRAQHILNYHHELLHDFFTPIRNKK